MEATSYLEERNERNFRIMFPITTTKCVYARRKSNKLSERFPTPDQNVMHLIWDNFLSKDWYVKGVWNYLETPWSISTVMNVGHKLESSANDNDISHGIPWSDFTRISSERKKRRSRSKHSYSSDRHKSLARLQISFHVVSRERKMSTFHWESCCFFIHFIWKGVECLQRLLRWWVLAVLSVVTS